MPTMEEKMHRLSLRLFNTLEGVGASEEMRHFYRRNLTGEIVQTVCFTLGEGKCFAMYIFGSFTEGTTTPDMGSDIDFLQSLDHTKAYADINTVPDGVSFLLVHEEGSYPGYVKLQFVHNRRPLTINDQKPFGDFDTDGKGRICVKHLQSAETKRHGPAISNVLPSGFSFDYVFAYRCINVPDFTTEWLRRCQRSGWPSADQLARMSQMNCFVVGVGHESSPERHIEWRLSFALQEREIMFNLNPVQHKCYILMKMIKKDIIEPAFENECCLSSYHCKTILFHTIASNLRDIWRPNNLIQCLMLCFQKLHSAINSSFCSLFFISDVNLFDRELFRQQQPSLLKEVRNILKQDYRIIRYIKCSKVGDSFINEEIPRHISDNVILKKLYIYNIHAQTFLCNCMFYRNSQRNDVNEMIHTLYEILHILTNTTTITEHSEQQTRDALSLIIPHIHHRLAVSLAARAMEASNKQRRQGLLNLSDYHFQYSQSIDVISSTLTYVTVLYRLGKFKLCRALLEEKDGALKQHVLSYCSCFSNSHAPHAPLMELVRNENMSQLCFNTSAVASCVMFMLSESSVVHHALSFEMVRSKDKMPEYRKETEGKWFNWAVVDSKVYFYFLQYLVYTRLNKPVHKQAAIDNLKWVIDDDENLGHTETAYNLLGWIYKEENHVEQAQECWKRSLEIRPHHNAAKWHYNLFLIHMSGQ